jgi:secreted PhoX family phosphatase
MNRRDFLRLAATSTAGAAGTILITSTAAASLLQDGSAIIAEADVKRGSIITPDQLLDEQVNVAQLGDNLAKILLNSPTGITVVPMHGQRDMFQVFGQASQMNEKQFTQHSKYKLVLGGPQSTSIMGRR